MPVNVSQQTMVFLACIIAGTVSGAIFDILGIIGAKLRFKKGAVFVKDLLFWAVTLAFFFSVIYKIDGAALSWFVFPGGCFGVAIYILVFRKRAVSVFSAVLDFLAKILWRILRILAWPARILLKFLRPIGKYVKNAQRRSGNFVKKNIEKIRRVKVLLNKV
ncbi:MAG: spore cortex biosynthesis protein YabQ [Clostridia bacterium]|nr:spore cortex biosynthesis protein YabQ [Clostridia bacterium]